jgi:phosphotransferase system enzyme I (PtsI)
MADLLAPYVKFFSLGTNDLIQYTLAIDRGNDRVAYLYEPTNTAILRLIKNTVDAGHKEKIWTGICGGMASDPLMTPLLIGLGLDELSVNPVAVPVVKDAVRSVTYAEARHIAEAALASTSAVDVHELARELTKKIAPEILELVE